MIATLHKAVVDLRECIARKVELNRIVDENPLVVNCLGRRIRAFLSKQVLSRVYSTVDL